MPLSYDHKILFIHIPKTGGTSIESFFDMTQPEHFSFYRWDRDQEEFLKKYGNLCNSSKMNYEPQHYPLAILKQLIPDYTQYFSFSFTRHPYTKLLSEYYWVNSKQLVALNDFNPDEFHAWCIHYLSTLDNSHKEPQINYIDSSVHFVGKFENLISDFEALKQELITFSPALSYIHHKPLTHENSTGLDKKELVPHLLLETKQLIYDIYRLDFEAFSYEKDLDKVINLSPKYPRRF